MRIEFSHSVTYKRWQGVERPLVYVTLQHSGLETSTYALLDSGADQSLFHAAIAADLGIDIYTGAPSQMEGVVAGATMMTWTHLVELTVGGISVGVVPVDFQDGERDDWSDQLIGRAGVFDNLRLAFCQAGRRIYLSRDTHRRFQL